METQTRLAIEDVVEEFSVLSNVMGRLQSWKISVLVFRSLLTFTVMERQGRASSLQCSHGGWSWVLTMAWPGLLLHLHVTAVRS